ncbi:MAG: GTPase Era [Synergistaceae bacterium]|nr:GTPase Era [Synergistaceae bacterium]
MRCGVAAIIGRPNAGKSTLVNALLKTKAAIVSPKPQTTRNAIRCIYNSADAQIIFTDTPGIHNPNNKLGKGLVDSAAAAMENSDVICYVVGADDAEISPDDAEIISLLKKVNPPVCLILNKIDKVSPNYDMGLTVDLYSKHIDIKCSVRISARKSLNLENFIGAILPFIPEGEPWYDPDILIDSTERFLASELIREQVLRYLRDEVPHCVAVDVEEYKSPDEYPDRKKLYISARLIAETEGQKGIIIGENGSMIRKIGQQSRLEIEKATGHPVYIDLRVQTRAGWRQSQNMLKRLGYA